MSKAFTREDDDRPERPTVTPRAVSLPPGAVNYITPQGAAQLRAELAGLLEHPSPEVAERIRYLQQTLPETVIMPPPVGSVDQVRFGATVTVRDQDGETTYRIVGVDETDTDQNWISWVSPLAKVLLNSRVEQHVRFRNLDLEILRVTYE